MGRHTDPNQQPEEITLEMVMDMVQHIPGATVSPIMPGLEVPDSFEPEHLSEDELKMIAGPVNRANVYTAVHGDLEAAKLLYGWIETSESPDQRELRYAVLLRLSDLHPSIDTVMAAADWIELGPNFEQRQRRLTMLAEHHAHNEHEIDADLAQAAYWIEG